MDFNNWTVAVGLGGAFGLGMCFAVLGSIAVKMMPRMNIDSAKFGSMISAFMFVCLIASLAVGVLQDKLGYQTVAIIGFAAGAASIFILANARTANAGMIACMLLGIGAMACNTTGNVLGTGVVQQMLKGNAVAANSLVNVFFGLGLFLTPMITSSLFQKVSYEKAVSALGVVLLIPLVCSVIAVFPAAPAGFALGDAVALLKEPVVLISGLVLFCYIALESSFTNWLAPFGKEVISRAQPGLGTDKVDASAARMLSAFAIAMMAGRLIMGLTKLAELGGLLIAGAAAIAAVIILIMTGAKTAGSAYALAAAAGLIFAPAFPATVGVTFEKMGGGSGSIFGIIFAMGLAGAVIVPKAIGNMAKGASVQKAIKLLLPVCAILLVLALVLHSRPSKAAPEAPAAEAAPAVEPAAPEAPAIPEAPAVPAAPEEEPADQ